jgi:hypothetical protein
MGSPSNGTLSMGPLWDYDLGFANVRTHLARTH